tara:strand:- start:935 stop:1813 length:879 start_codon:yes stop_codon:yes gene_type:complete
MQSYYQILVKNLPKEKEDIFAAQIFEWGASGISEKLDFSQNPDHYEPRFLEKDHIDLEVYFESLPAKDLLENLKSHFPEVECEMLEAQNQDWLQEWKKGFQAFLLAGDTWVVPSWLTKPEGVKDCIYIDPGLAFGTGTHATTQLCAALLFDYIGAQRFGSILDVGCGTGILSIYAGRLGLKKIDATEIDEDARACAKENVEKNHSASVNILDKQVSELDETYDLLVANIIDGVLLQLREDFMRNTKSGSYFLLSGILQERKEIFETKFIQKDFQVLDCRQQDEWLAYVLKRY